MKCQKWFFGHKSGPKAPQRLKLIAGGNFHSGSIAGGPRAREVEKKPKIGKNNFFEGAPKVQNFRILWGAPPPCAWWGD